MQTLLPSTTLRGIYLEKIQILHQRFYLSVKFIYYVSVSSTPWAQFRTGALGFVLLLGLGLDNCMSFLVKDH